MPPYHPQVEKLLADFEMVVGGPQLDDEALKRWAAILATSDAREQVGLQLIALAIRFHEEGGDLAARQLLVLGIVALGEDRATRAVSQGFEATGAAMELIKAAAGQATTLTDGLAPSGPTGVGLRRGPSK